MRASAVGSRCQPLDLTDEALAFSIAAARLQTLLQEAAWDQAEAVRSELATFSPAMKLTFLSNIGSLVTMIAFGVSWITGEDPLGGLRLSQSSLDAAVTGALASLPLVCASLLTRTRSLRATLPLIEDLHAAQATLLQPLLKDLNPSQLLIVASTTVLPLLFLLLPAMHGLAAMLALVTHTQVVQPVIAAGTSAVHEAQHAMVAAAGGAASDPTAAAHASAEAPAALGAAAAASSALPPASPPWAWLLLSPIVHPQPDAAAAVEAAASTGTSSAAAAAYHAAGASPAATATAATTVASPSSLWTTWHPLSADLAASGAGGDAQQLAVEGSGSAAGASGAVEDEEDLEEDDVATAWWWSLQLVPLSPPMLLPLGGPDLVGMARVLAMQAMEPSTAILVRNVGREALALMPAILSGFVAAYTVMRQLAPRRSQVWAIRDALLASDRFFRLHISMARHGNPGSSSLASLASMDEPLGPSSSSSRAPSAAASSSSSAPGGTPPLPPPRESPQGSSSSEQLVGQLAPPGPAAPPAASAVPSSAGASAAVSDAFRKVAVLWLLTRRKVCQLSYLLTSMSVMYLALWWSETGDLAAPATAALISCTLELWLCQREGQQASARNGGGVPPTRGAPPR